LVPNFRSSDSIEPPFYELRRQRRFAFEVPERIRRLCCRNFKQAALDGVGICDSECINSIAIRAISW
jgi:hypothetical protein